VPVQAIPVKLTSFSVRDIIPHLTFYTKTEKMLYLCLATLVKDGFLKTSNVKRSGINQEVVTYSLVETQELDFPTWKTICRNITKVKEVTEGKEVTIVTQVGELA
jgi:DNA-binding PadR family transcriptional regulator